MNTLEKPFYKKTIEFHKPTLTKEELRTVLDCLVDDQLDSGIVVEQFEKEFKNTFSFKNVISTNSLFSAYHLSFLALSLNKGDKVLLSTYAPLSAFYAIQLMELEPILVDLGRGSFHMNLEQFHEKFQLHQPKVVLVDHTFGCLFDCKNLKIQDAYLIEDFSESLGADSSEVMVGKQGTISICGLGSEHVITTGNGAVIVTNQDGIAEKIRLSKTSKQDNPKKKYPTLRFDYNLLDFQAGIGIEQISKLGVILERKKKIAQVYLQAVLSGGHETFFKNASQDQFNRFPIIFNKPYEEAERYFAALQIGTARTTKEPIHRILGLPNTEFPNAERLYQRGHCLPIYASLTKESVSRIANSIKAFY